MNDEKEETRNSGMIRHYKLPRAVEKEPLCQRGRFWT
jgi:hypothetical protein